MSDAGVLETLARVFGEALGPLEHRLQTDGLETTLDQLGLRLPAGALGAGDVEQSLQASAGACAQLPEAVTGLVDAISGGDDDAMIGAAATLGQRVVQAVVAFTQLAEALDTAIHAAAALTPAQMTRLRDSAQALPERLLTLALVAYLDEKRPTVRHGLALAGIIEDTPVPGDPADPTLPPHTIVELRFDRLGTLVSDPAQHFKDLYKFGQADFDGLELFRRIKDMVDLPDHQAQLITVPGMPPALDAFMFRLAVTTDPIPGLRVRLRQPAEKDFDFSIPISELWSVTAKAQARFEGGIEFVVHPDAGVNIEPPFAAVSIALTMGIRAARADGSPMIILGQAGGSRLELQSFSAGVPLQLSASTGSPSPKAAIGASVAIDHGKLVIDTSNADGFIGQLLSGIHIESEFDLSATYDTTKGLQFTGSATIEIAIPTHIQLGPLEIPNLYLIGGFKDGTVPVEFSADLSAKLGPLNASVSRIGAVATISFPKGGGNAGAVQIGVAFKPPNGVGLSINAGVVQGGGFLYVDPDKGEYAGALELTFADFLSLKAIGIITTRMPDGSQGFSLLVIITVEFGTGLQLGYGFTLIGVGGLVGLNRTMRLDALAEGVRSGSIHSVMFPTNIVANAPRIISDLKAFFPPQKDRFLIGPMAKIGWGAALISLSLGIIIEIPGNVAIVGVLGLTLPPGEDDPVVVLQVSFIGAIEFDKSRGWFFASLYDSRILFITIDGDMGLLIAFGSNADFVLSVGGFHPRYPPPPLPFPSPHRISLEILNTSVAKIRAQAYFAVTTNSVQLGCLAEVFFGFNSLSLSGSIQFDALLRFSPPYLLVAFSAQFGLTVFGVGVFSLRIRLELEGPKPWHAHGSASLSMLFFDVEVDIDKTWGEQPATTLTPIAVLAKLVEELSKDQSWRALPPPGSHLLVSLRKLPDDQSTMVLHPLGSLQISQRIAPLDSQLDRVGTQRPSDGKRFALSSTSATFTKRGDVNELFAPAQFRDLSDDERLARKPFEPMHGGLELSVAGDQYESGAAIARADRYDLITVDTNARRHRRRFSELGSLLFSHWLGGSAVRRSALSAKTRKSRVPVADGVRSVGEGFAVAMQQDNRAAASGAASFASESAARQWMADAVATDPTLAGSLHVVPQFELVGK